MRSSESIEFEARLSRIREQRIRGHIMASEPVRGARESRHGLPRLIAAGVIVIAAGAFARDFDRTLGNPRSTGLTMVSWIYGQGRDQRPAEAVAAVAPGLAQAPAAPAAREAAAPAARVKPMPGTDTLPFRFARIEAPPPAVSEGWSDLYSGRLHIDAALFSGPRPPYPPATDPSAVPEAISVMLGTWMRLLPAALWPGNINAGGRDQCSVPANGWLAQGVSLLPPAPRGAAVARL